MEEKCYTVYMHIFPNNKVYVGITCRKPKYRWDNGNGYKNNKYMTNAIQKYGWNNIEHKILFTDLMKEEAERKEIELIAFYKSNQRKYGYNILEGGNAKDGLPEDIRKIIALKHKGKSLTEEHKKKISEAEKGKKVSKETCEKISIALKGKPKSKEAIEKSKIKKIGKPTWNKGKHGIYTEEQLKKMSINSKKMWQKKEYREKMCKKVICIELNIIFNSVTEAAKYFNFSNNSHISECCKGKLESCGKYNGIKLHWKYIKEE